MLEIILPLFAYLFGSFSSAVVVSRIMDLPDPRSSGSHNPGATNVFRLGGKKAAVIVLVVDLLKGLLPILMARGLSESPLTIALVGMAAFLGHLYPLFFSFKGGKGVATAAGVFAGTELALGGLLVSVWLASAVIFRYSSLSALIAAVAAPLLAAWLLPKEYFVMSLLMAVLLCWRHRTNIRRLLGGEESKIKFRSLY